MKYILDTDPGVDDALALMYARCVGIPINAITTVYGNANITHTTTNALTLLDLLQWDVPVYQGLSGPLRGSPVIPKSHGDNGLGGFVKSHRKKREPESAIEFITNTLVKSCKKEVTFICFGPTTNIASVLIARPDLISRVHRVIILGGVLGEKGNMTPYAEFNVLNDPSALEIVLTVGCDITLVPINICRQVILTRADILTIRNKMMGDMIQEITDIYLQYYTSNDEYAGFQGGVMYDLLAVMQISDSELFTTIRERVCVDASYGVRYGETKIIPGTPNVDLVTGVDVPEVKRRFLCAVNLN